MAPDAQGESQLAKTRTFLYELVTLPFNDYSALFAFESQQYALRVALPWKEWTAALGCTDTQLLSPSPLAVAPHRLHQETAFALVVCHTSLHQAGTIMHYL